MLGCMMKQTIALTTVLLAAAGCHKTEAAVDAGVTAASASASVAIVAAVAPDTADDDAGVTIAPPAPLITADAKIPLNEAVVGAPSNLPADYSASFAPPVQAVDETDRPPQPDAESTWVPGYWWYSQPLNRYVWVGGAWRRPPPDQIWVSGSWISRGGRYHWQPGYWGPRGYLREEVDVAPPPMRVEVRPVAPAADFTWQPGYYVHRSGAYTWTPGVWVRPPRVGVTWIEPRYVNTGGRYYLQPGRWDVPVERRGVVYQPNIDVKPGARVVLAPVDAHVVVEHERFVRESSRAIAHGVVAVPRGQFVVPRAIVREHVEPGRVEEHVRVEEHRPEVRVEEHARVPEPRVETRVETRAPHVETRVEVHNPQVQVQVQQQNQRRPQEPRHR